MRRRGFLTALGGAVLAAPFSALAQQPLGIPRIGVLMGGTPSVEAARLGAFRDGLEKLGFVDGQNILIVVRYAMGQLDRLGGLAGELAALAPAVIVCVGQQEILSVRAATRTIPIVFMQVTDPVEQGFVASLSRPGGNTTGFSQMSAELDPKRLQLLREIVPSLSRVAFLVNPTLNSTLDKRFPKTEAAAKSLGIALRRVDAATPDELSAALAAIEASADEALLVQSDPLFATERARIVDFATAHRLPTAFQHRAYVASGGLFSYGPDIIDNARRAAGYVAKILKGANPADLPVQQPTRFQLVVNLKTAKAIGITIPPTILNLADEVIE
jgi:putative tryptophan/tyrosine transport system substrate-binding protein